MDARIRGADETRRFHLLVVEPDAQVREVLSSAFEETGIDVIAVRGAREAQAVLSARGVDFALIEIILWDGTAEVLAEFAEEHGSAVALVSGHPDGIRRGEGGRWCFVEKPFSVLKLRRLVLAELASAAGRRARD